MQPLRTLWCRRGRQRLGGARVPQLVARRDQLRDIPEDLAAPIPLTDSLSRPTNRRSVGVARITITSRPTDRRSDGVTRITITSR